ncbi:MAG: aminotransferase class III-fold pyridoxal phosphate-dependent enzyme [Deltaproteobacteria bacterium]|nr:aminotransferase class III-fold pyridoxal phosphate-dependent enzyme [Deltaproteobacteria bacterium]
MTLAASTPAPRFDRIIASPQALPRASVGSLAELIFAPRPGEEPAAPIILGCFDHQPLTVSLATLRRVILELGERLRAFGLTAGDTVALVRLPRTSETLTAVVYAALSAWGYRVFLPMYVEGARFGRWLRLTCAKAVLWSAKEVDELHDDAGDREVFAGLEKTTAALGIPTYCLMRDLGLPGRLADRPARDADHAAGALAPRASASTECLVLTTSGSTGDVKLVRYAQGGILQSLAAWEQAGLFAPEVQGGRGLALLFAHSMGIRAFWNAVWTRTPICLITPEWFLEKPEWVRALILAMRPAHVTGGPATFLALLEIARAFPELKKLCLQRLKAAVVSGAPFDHPVARRFEVATGLAPQNAFGMTETMQICSTLVAPRQPPANGAIGAPLPGVRLGLERQDGFREPTFALHVASPFGCTGFIEADANDRPHEVEAPEWLDSGDLVTVSGDELRFVARAAADFVKDGFGVKVPLARVATFYDDLGAPIDQLLCFPLSEEPGLAALVFVEADAAPGTPQVPGTVVTDLGLKDAVQSRLEHRGDELHHQLEDFEHRHFTIDRFVLVRGPCPRTAKGTADLRLIRERHRTLITEITGRFVKQPGFGLLQRDARREQDYVRFTSPRQGALMRLAKLDKHYHRGAGDRLFYDDHGKEIEVIDFVGGYGGNLFGHRNKEIVTAAADFLSAAEVPICDQGSARRPAGDLARLLSTSVARFTGQRYVVRLGSTGAEAVEMALAHALLEREEAWHRLRRDLRREFGSECPDTLRAIEADNEALLRDTPVKILALEGAFHGHSAAARSTVWSSTKRRPFAPLAGVSAVFLPPDAPADLDGVLAEHALPLAALCRTAAGEIVATRVPFSRVIAAIAEPLQGEGGVREVSPALLATLARQPFPLILDEIQTGLGRTGRFLASQGVAGAYYLFSKALGGGVAKISALLVNRRRYVPRFDELYSSTFAGDALSCRVATRVLELVEADRIAARAEERGRQLGQALLGVKQAYPRVIREVRGRGLLWGVALDPEAARDTYLLRATVDRELYGVFAAAYLLNRHRLRLLPTLSAPNTLRVEPSAYIDDDAIDRLRSGLGALCDAIHRKDSAELFSFLVDDEQAFAAVESVEPAPPPLATTLEPATPGVPRIGFISHMVAPERDLLAVEPSTARYSKTARRALTGRLTELTEMKPTRVYARHLLQGRVHLTSIIATVDVATLQGLHRMKFHRRETERIQEAVDWAAALGCDVVALGAYTSILTRDGRGILPPCGVRITSGNSFTVALGSHRLLEACLRERLEPTAPETRLAVVGATGNIGTGLCERLFLHPPGFAAGLLVGLSEPKLAALRARLQRARPELDLQIATEVAALERAAVVVAATNTNEPIIFARHLAARRRTIIADLSVPAAVADDVARLPQVVTVPLSGTVAMPGDEGVVLSAHTAPGTLFACAAEAVLLALEPERTRSLSVVGDIDRTAVVTLETLAEHHQLLTPLAAPAAGTAGARSR